MANHHVFSVANSVNRTLFELIEKPNIQPTNFNHSLTQIHQIVTLVKHFTGFVLEFHLFYD